MNQRSKFLAILFASVSSLLLCYSQLEEFSAEKMSTIDGKEYRTRVAQVEHFLQSQLDALNISGLSVALIEDAKVVYYQAVRMKEKEKEKKIDQSPLFEAASMNKQVFAYAVLKLVGQGVLNLTSPLYRYYPSHDRADDSCYSSITAGMVLNHTSGLPNWQHEKFRELIIDAEPGANSIFR